MLGNPPWEKVQFTDKEFFAAHDPEIAKLAGAKRKAAIAALKNHDTELWTEFQLASRHAEAESDLLRHSGRYPSVRPGAR